MTTTTTPSTTEAIEVSGAVLTYEVRHNEQSDEPTLFLIGSPMGAAGFGTLASYFPDRRIVTYDPRGVERSVKDDIESPVDPDIHADDISRIIAAVGDGPVDVFASSGGAVNSLALVARHPEQVRTLVAHEPPLAALLPDAEAAMDACRAVAETYQREGFGAGMAHFIAVVSHEGPFTSEFSDQPVPAPGDFGLPEEDDGSKSDPLLGQNMISCTTYIPDLDALRNASTRIVVGAGVESGKTLPSRSAYALADKLGLETVLFPSHHAGFLGGEYDQTGDPDAFGPALHQALSG